MADQVFLYRAFGIAFGGSLTRPFSHPIENQAATALSVVGGYTSSRVTDFRLNGLSFKSAHTYITGNQAEDGSFNTVVTTTIERLNVFDAVTVDGLTARITSQHVKGAAEPSITTAGTAFHGLRIAGAPTEVLLDADLSYKLTTYSTLRKAFADNKAFAESKGITRCALVKETRVANAPFEVTNGCEVRVPDVGRVYLGEFFVSPYARRLVMLRLELGSPFAGRVVAAEAEANGTTYP